MLASEPGPLEHFLTGVRGLLSPETDQLLLRARASGERLVATVRLCMVVGLSCLGLALGAINGLLLVSTGLGYSVILAWLAFRAPRPWTSWLSCAADVTLVTGTLFYVMIQFAAPVAVTNSRTYYDLYFLAIMNAGLRYDWRLCLGTALLAVMEYGGLTALAIGHWNAAGVVDAQYGKFNLSNQILRLVLLMTAGGIMATIAARAKTLRLMVGVDHLTGLSQRAPFVERVDEELSRSRRRGSALSVAILDIDGFKGFNDAFGHPSGDRALQLLAGRLRSSVRKSDLVARFGGEEFVVAFPETEVEQATARVEAIRLELARVQIPVGRDLHRLTVSAGVGSWPADGDTFEAVLDRADTRLFEAKRKGRNQVIGPPPAHLATVTELKKR